MDRLRFGGLESEGRGPFRGDSVFSLVEFLPENNPMEFLLNLDSDVIGDDGGKGGSSLAFSPVPPIGADSICIGSFFN